MISEYPQGTTGDHWEYRQGVTGGTYDWTGQPVLMPIDFLTNCRWVYKQGDPKPANPTYVADWLGEFVE